MSRPNPQQHSAIQHDGSPLLVLAGAGSGKTRVITEKIIRLVNTLGVSPNRITAVTFTNKAAREMRKRIGDALASDKEAARRLTISTFHSLGMRILRSHLDVAGLSAGFSIIDPTDAQNVVGDFLARKSGRNPDMAERIYYTISRWKNDGLPPDSPQLPASNPAELAAQTIYPEYERYLRACNSVDLDDLIFLPTRLLREHPEVRQTWREKIHYLLVDEYQDTNGAQYDMVKLLVADGSHLTVVGDDDQSIYSWRGARPENLVRLQQDFGHLEVVKLEQNYRSVGRILTVANQLIARNPRPFEKRLWSEKGYGDAVRIVAAKNDDTEAEKIVSALMTKQFQSNCRYSDFAILYRSNHQARVLETKLREMRIPYRLSGGMSFFDRAEIRDAMAYIRLLSNNSDDTAFLRIINTPRRGIGATSLEKLATLARDQACSLLDAALSADLDQHIPANRAERLRAFAERMVHLGDNAERGDPADVVGDLLAEISYQDWLRESGDESTADRRWENVESLLSWIRQLSETRDPETGKTWGPFGCALALRAAAIRFDIKMGPRGSFITFGGGK